MFEVKDFLHFRSHILQMNPKKYRDDFSSLQQYLKDDNNYELDVDKEHLEFLNDDNDVFKDLFNVYLTELLTYHIIESTYEFDDGCVLTSHNVTQIGDKYFYYSYDEHYASIDDIQEVFPTEVTVRTFKFSNGFLTNDELDIVE